MSFTLGVAYKDKKDTGDKWDWEYICSSASHMTEIIDTQKVFGSRVYAIKTPSGDVMEMASGKWTLKVRSKNFVN